MELVQRGDARPLARVTRHVRCRNIRASGKGPRTSIDCFAALARTKRRAERRAERRITRRATRRATRRVARHVARRSRRWRQSPGPGTNSVRSFGVWMDVSVVG